MVNLKNITIVLFLTTIGFMIFGFLHFSKHSQSTSYNIGGNTFIFTVEDTGEIRQGDSENTFGYDIGDYGIGGIIELINPADTPTEIDSWLNLYNVSYNYDIGIETKEQDKFVYLNTINGVNLYRKQAFNSSHLSLYGEFKENRLSPVFIDEKNYKWRITYYSKDQNLLNEGDKNLILLDQFIKNLQVE